MRTLVTGGAGFIGSHLVRALVERGDEVVVLDSLEEQVHHGEVPELPAGVELIVGNVGDSELADRALSGVDRVVHLAAAVGVGQSMYEIARYTELNTMATARFLERVVAQRPMPIRLVVASSMSIYGEGEYVCEEHGRMAPVPRPEEQLLARQWELACPDCGQELTPVGTSRDQAADPDLDLRDQQARPRGDVPRDRRRLRHPGGRAALLQRLWPGPGALEPVHGRGCDLRLAPAQPARAGDLRGRRAVARLHARVRHRQRHPARARVRGGSRARPSTSARAARPRSTRWRA